MVSAESIEKQLKALGFKASGWGRTEVQELRNIILPDEEIFECVNGIYEGGFALLLATDLRVLLVDKKPLNYLTVEDLRFDMINEIDYSHRLIGAHIRISAGETQLKFTSVNQPRLRKLIGHVQRCIAENKKRQSSQQEGQHRHLKRINRQLEFYLAQYRQQQQLQEQWERMRASQSNGAAAAIPPLAQPMYLSPELEAYLTGLGGLPTAEQQPAEPVPQQPGPMTVVPSLPEPPTDQMAELYSAGMKEIFDPVSRPAAGAHPPAGSFSIKPLEIHPLHIAYSKLPAVLKERKLKRLSLHLPSRGGGVTANPAHQEPYGI